MIQVEVSNALRERLSPLIADLRSTAGVELALVRVEPPGALD